MNEKIDWATDKKLNAVHIGGGGTFGPIEETLLPLGKDLHFTIIEANLDSISWRQHELRAINRSKSLGFTLNIVPACISDKIGEATFYIAANALASSLYPMAPSAHKMKRASGTKPKLNVWNRTCQTVKEIPIATTTLDQLIIEEKMPLPNFLSMDIQGADYDALAGAKSLLQGESLSCILCEAEFRELYDGQKLFHDLHKLLLDNGFFLGDFPYQRHWYTGYVFRRGFMTVVEALYLKDYHNISTFSELIKLALAANQFNFLSYTYEIVQHVEAHHSKQWQMFCEDKSIGYNAIIAESGRLIESQVKMPLSERIFPQ